MATKILRGENVFRVKKMYHGKNYEISKEEEN
jgi:hypothetical protein